VCDGCGTGLRAGDWRCRCGSRTCSCVLSGLYPECPNQPRAWRGAIRWRRGEGWTRQHGERGWEGGSVGSGGCNGTNL